MAENKMYLEQTGPPVPIARSASTPQALKGHRQGIPKGTMTTEELPSPKATGLVQGFGDVLL